MNEEDGPSDSGCTEAAKLLKLRVLKDVMVLRKEKFDALRLLLTISAAIARREDEATAEMLDAAEDGEFATSQSTKVSVLGLGPIILTGNRA